MIGPPNRYRWCPCPQGGARSDRWGAGLISLSPPRREDQAGWEGASLRWRISVVGRLCGQSPLRGACRSEGLGGVEHPPDGLGELAGDVDTGDLRAALLAQAGLGALVALGVDGVAGGVGGRLDQCPAQVL